MDQQTDAVEKAGTNAIETAALRAIVENGIALPDGRRVRFPRKPIGRDLVKAGAAAGNRGQIALFMALAAQLASVETPEGKKSGLTYEEIEEMDLEVVFSLVGAVVGNLSPGLATLLG